jgi:hypothetical protein
MYPFGQYTGNIHDPENSLGLPIRRLTHHLSDQLAEARDPACRTAAAEDSRALYVPRRYIGQSAAPFRFLNQILRITAQLPIEGTSCLLS